MEQLPEQQTRQRAKKNKPTSRGKITLAAVVLLAACLIGGYAFLTDTAPVDRNNAQLVELTIAPGTSADQIIAALKEQGLIKNETAFKFYLKKNNLGGKLRAGSYALSPSMSIPEIVDALLNGIGETVKFTIPEGYTLRDIADTFDTQQIMTKDEFWAIVTTEDYSQYSFLEQVPQNEHRLEGFLFPDTYIIAKGSTPADVIEVMLKRFQQVYDNLPENESGLSVYDMIILASMIESEAKFDEERPTIASVYLNRLKQDMPMQCDATILYGMPERKTKLYFSDYKFESEYNTYLFKGFPPTPICNPGQQSLIAACQPEETDYLYYLWDKINNDGHVFAETYDGHLANRKTYGY